MGTRWTGNFGDLRGVPKIVTAEKVTAEKTTGIGTLQDAARKRADYNLKVSPDLAGISLFTSDDTVRLAILDPVTVPSLCFRRRPSGVKGKPRSSVGRTFQGVRKPAAVARVRLRIWHRRMQVTDPILSTPGRAATGLLRLPNIFSRAWNLTCVAWSIC